MLIEMLGEVAGSVLTGGATGILGTALSFVTQFFQRRQAHKQELELRRLDMELAQIEAASLERAIQVEAESEREQAAWSALEASYRDAAARWSRAGDGFLMTFVDFCRGMTRPVLTVLFLGLTGAIYFSLGSGETAMRGQLIDTVLYLTVTCVLWWFGARQLAKAPGTAAR